MMMAPDGAHKPATGECDGRRTEVVDHERCHGAPSPKRGVRQRLAVVGKMTCRPFATIT
jgi:hypothetical protein